MKMKTKKLLNGIDLTPYRRHPRFTELRVVLIYESLVRVYNEVWAQAFVKHWCDLNSINSTLIRGLLNQTTQIKRLSLSDKVRYRQEVVLMGYLSGEGRVVIATKFLNLSARRLYKDPGVFDVNMFVDKDWLEDLHNNVVVCGMLPYRVEAERFLDSLAMFHEVLVHVSMAKV